MSSIYSYGGASGGTPVQLCQRCGSPLPFNEVYCGTCGYVNPATTAGNPTERASFPNTSWGNPAPQAQPQTAYGQNQFTGTAWGQPSVQPAPPPSGSLYNAPSVPQQPFPGIPGQPGQASSPPYPDNFSNVPAQSSNNLYGMPGQTPLPSSANNFYGTSGAQSNPNNFYAMPDTTGTQSNPNNFYSASGQVSDPNYYGAPAPIQQGFSTPSAPLAMPGGLQPGGMNGYQPGGFEQPPEQKRKPNTGLIISIVILLIVLIGGGLGGYVYVKQHNTSTTQSLTPTATATATPSVHPLFSDTFQDNNKGWDLTSEAGKFSAKVGGGTLILEDDENRLLPELIPGGQTFSNFRLSVDAVLSKGTQDNGYGVYIRGASNQNSDLATYYRFEIYGDGSYAVFKGTVDANGNSNSSQLVNYHPSSVVQKAGSVNHITIIANGPGMSFIVNGQTLTTPSDSSYTSGSIALFVSNIQGAPPIAQATFSKLYIYPSQA